jgi:hypothetical protein
VSGEQSSCKLNSDWVPPFGSHPERPERSDGEPKDPHFEILAKGGIARTLCPHPKGRSCFPVKRVVPAFSPQPAENIRQNSFPKFADHFPLSAHTHFMVLNQDVVSGAQYGDLANPRRTASAGLSRQSMARNFF